MDLLQLKYFQTVAMHEHMTHAADELHVAQPSLSKAIGRLEEDLGIPLFDRIGRQIKLNQFGKVFLHRVERVFLELEDAKKELWDMQGNENEKVSIAVNNLYPFSKLLEGYLELYPHTSFRQTIGTTVKMQQQLQNGDVDFCISSLPIKGDYIKCIPLITEEIFLIVPYGHRFANRKSINLIEVANEPFISLPKGFSIRDLTETLCHQAGFTPNIIFESDIAANIINMINLNLGISLLPTSQWSGLQENKPFALHIIEPICKQTTSLSFVQDHYLSKAAKQFKDYIIDYFEKHRYNNC